jgi:hypothetical protein
MKVIQKRVVRIKFDIFTQSENNYTIGNENVDIKFNAHDALLNNLHQIRS